MKNMTLMLPGFHLPTLRRTPRSARQKLAEEMARIRSHSLIQLGDCFRRFIPYTSFSQHDTGHFSRRRIFSKENTFWAFFSQVLNADSGCREVVRKLQALAAARHNTIPSSSTAAYCQARHKLDEQTLDSILTGTGELLHQRGGEQRWKQRRVIVVDGTGVSMPDTADNQSDWPQPGNQKPGCGFPQARLCACFCLVTGALLSHRIGDRKRAELPLLRDQWETFAAGDIMLGDKGFCSYYDVWQLQQRGVDSVFTLARRTPVETARAVALLGDDDLLIQWPKPKWNPRLSYSKAQWQALPDQLTLRQIKVTVNTPGFRVSSFYLVTTLTDASAYTATELADLYYRRWDVELFFRDIKATMGMDILRCRTPSMVRKEIIMHLIVYNSLRLLMLDAAQATNVTPRRISFKASMQALRHFEPQLSRTGLSEAQRRHLMAALQSSIAEATLSYRPGRREPRCVKRRPKPFAFLTQPRHQMIEIPHRSRYLAKPH